MWLRSPSSRPKANPFHRRRRSGRRGLRHSLVLTALPLAALLLVLILCPAPGASYVVELVNEKQFTTPSYWTEGEEIECYRSSPGGGL